MKMISPGFRRCEFCTRPREGSTILVILVLLACLMVLLAANSTTLHVLKQELKQIDEKQQQKYGQGARH